MGRSKCSDSPIHCSSLHLFFFLILFFFFCLYHCLMYFFFYFLCFGLFSFLLFCFVAFFCLFSDFFFFFRVLMILAEDGKQCKRKENSNTLYLGKKIEKKKKKERGTKLLAYFYCYLLYTFTDKYFFYKLR